MICFCVYAIDVVVVVGGGSDDCIFRFHRIIRYFYAMNERRTCAVSFYAMNQQVDSKFQRCVPIQMAAFFRHSTCLPIEKDAPTCKCFLHIQPNDDSEKTILGVRAQILCVFYVPVSKTKGMFKDKIRLKRLHSAQTSLFYDENIHFWANRHTTAHQIAATSLGSCVCVVVSVHCTMYIPNKQDLHAHIIYYRESRVNHRVIFKPDCLCLPFYSLRLLLSILVKV